MGLLYEPRPPERGGFREGSDYIRKRDEMSLLRSLPDVQAYPLQRAGPLRNRQEQKASRNAGMRLP